MTRWAWTSTPWVVWSFEHNSWWAPGGMGYRTPLLLAGIYTQAQALKIAANANQYPDPRLITPENPRGNPELAMPLSVAIVREAEGHTMVESVAEWFLRATPADLRALGFVQDL